MALRIGVIGVGMIGQDHIRRLTTVLAGSTVTAVSDTDAARAREVAARFAGVEAFATGEELIASPAVDAVLVCSWGPSHRQYVTAAIRAGKFVFCEKPLATTERDCLAIIDAEVAHGSRLVQVGFMRRYDPAYRAMKASIDGGEIGAPLMFHSCHRNASVPSHYTADMAIVDTAVHDIDVARWLFAEEVSEVMVVTPKKSARGGLLQDPLLILLRMAGGAIVDVETSVNIDFGYDIRGEIVGETGTVALAESATVLVKRGGTVAARVPEDWRERFSRAYDVELQDWVDGCLAGTASGPSSWDGYAATVVTDAGLAAAASMAWAKVNLRDKPSIYG
jgi:myo-inositol 2-dehydrogenase/D-chiro-inositol 1-dehydrogenase